MAGYTTQMKYVFAATETYYNNGEMSGLEGFAIPNPIYIDSVALPEWKQKYDLNYFSAESIEDKKLQLKEELKQKFTLFDQYKNGVKYPKIGTTVSTVADSDEETPSTENTPPEISEKETFSNDKGDFDIEIQPYDNTSPDLNNPAVDNTQMRNITGQVVGEVPDDNSNASTQGVYNVTVYTADDFGGTPSKNVVRVKTDTNGYFSMSVPKDTKFISARIKSDAANATPDSFLVDSVEFNSDKDYYLLQLKLQQVDEVKINIGGGYEAPTRPPTLLITAEGYESKEIIPYKGDGTPKTDIGIIELTPIDKSLENDIIESSQLSQDNVKKITSPKKTADYYIQKRLFKVVQNLKDTLIPIVLTLLAKFGITAAQSIIGKGKEAMKEAIQNKTYCPPQSEISLIIQKKNRIVNGLNNSLKIIDATTIALGIVGGLLTGLEIALNFIVITPIPTPPAIPVAITKSEKLIAKLKAGNAGLLAILVLLRQTIIIIIDLLSLLDMAIENCSPRYRRKTRRNKC
jgi:hypothetical protein